MVGRDIPSCAQCHVHNPGKTLISLENIRALNDKGLPGLKDITLQG